MLIPRRTAQFKRDYKRMQKRGANLDKLRHIMETLIEERPLEHRHQDHALTGNWIGHRDCHIEPDWVLIYYVDAEEITFVRTGSHSDLSF